MDFDFARWSRLARENPAEFERQRESTLRATIALAPSAHRQRLEELQFRLDAARRCADSPCAPWARPSSLMWAGLHSLRRQLNTAAGKFHGEALYRVSAEIISLQAARERCRDAGREVS